MVAPRPPPKISRSPPPSSSASPPPPPSNSSNPAQPMRKIVRLVSRRDGTPTSTTTAAATTPTPVTTNNNAPIGSAARPVVSTIRTIPTTAGGRQPIRRRPSPSPAPDAAASTLERSSPAPAAPAAEAPSRSAFVLRRDGLPGSQQPLAGAQGAGPVARPGWKRRRPVATESAVAPAAMATATAAPAATSLAAVASMGSQETPEAKRQQVDRGEKAESGTGVAVPKSASPPRAVVEVSAGVPAAVRERRRSPSPASAPAADEAKASTPPTSSDPSPAPQQQARDSSSPSDLTTSPPEELETTADPRGLKAVVPATKPVVVEDPKPAEPAAVTMDVDPVAVEQPATVFEVGSGGTTEQITQVDEDDSESDAFVALIAKHAEMMQKSTLWMEEALQSIRNDFSKAAAASDAGKVRLGELVRMSITDLFEPAVECTRALSEATDAFTEEAQRYCAEGGGKSDMVAPA